MSGQYRHLVHVRASGREANCSCFFGYLLSFSAWESGSAASGYCEFCVICLHSTLSRSFSASYVNTGTSTPETFSFTLEYPRGNRCLPQSFPLLISSVTRDSQFRATHTRRGCFLLRMATTNLAVAPFPAFTRVRSLRRVMPTRRSFLPRRNRGWLNSSQVNPLVAAAAAAASAAPCRPQPVEVKLSDGVRFTLRKPRQGAKKQRKTALS